MENGELTPERKTQIDAMTHRQICSTWRFAKSGNPLVTGETGDYLAAKLKEFGGFTSEISKSLGW